MSVESETARADLMAAGIIAEHFGQVRAASAESFAVPYQSLRALIAVAYLRGKREGLAEAGRIVRAP